MTDRRLIAIKRFALACAAFTCHAALFAPGAAFGQSAPAPEPVPLTLARYSAELTQVQADCAAAASSQGDAKAAGRALAAITPLLHAVVVVPGPSGESSALVFVDNRPLAGLMQSARQAQAAGAVSAGEARAAAWRTISDDVAQIRSALPLTNAAAPSQATGDARVIAGRVLAGADFASEPLPPKSIWERMGEAIERWWNRLHWRRDTPAGRSEPVSPLLPELILIVGSIVAIGLIVYFTTLWLRRRGERAATDALGSRLDLAFTAEEKELVASRNYARLRALADEAAKSGDFRSAYRLVFLAILVFLDAEGAIRLDRAQTNWEYLRALPSDCGGKVPDIIRPVVQEFDRIWYGARPATRGEFDMAAGAYTAARQAVEQERATVDQGRLAAAASGAGQR